MQLLKICFVNNLHREKIKLNILNYPAPPDGERKKPLLGQAVSCAHFAFIPIGGFEKSRPPFFYALIRNDALTLARSAAYGGSRHEAKSVSTK